MSPAQLAVSGFKLRRSSMRISDINIQQAPTKLQLC